MLNLESSLGLQPKATRIPGVKRLIFIPHSDEYTYTVGTDGAISTIAATDAETGYEFIMPRGAGQVAITYSGDTEEHSITITSAHDGLNNAVSQAVQGLEESTRFIVLYQSKKSNSVDAYRVLGRYNGLVVGSGNEDTATTGSATINTQTIVGVEPVKPEWIELTADEPITGALTNFTITPAV